MQRVWVRGSEWLVVILRVAVLGLAAVFGALTVVLGGIAQNRVPSEARWTSIGAYPEFWVAVVSGLIAVGLSTSFDALARWLGSIIQRRAAVERDRALVMAYLRARIAAWDTPEWSHEVPSVVERRLTVATIGDSTQLIPQTLTEEGALVGRRLLVVLGGPGSGKTWLARRYARRSAEVALAALDGGAVLAEVELPVYTTWDRWSRLADGRGDSVRASLVASSFDADVHHGGGETAEAVTELREILNRGQTRILFVVDSLDEATGRDHSARLGNLVGLANPQARVVVTSRPGAWGRVSNRLPEKDDTCLVVELQNLSYPKDVESFVGAWFEHDPMRARAVIDQLRTRSDVARAAVVPLILTFYCLVAADGVPSAPLPARRHDLYDRIIAQSLARANITVGADPDYRHTERINQLQAWAWHAVGTSNTPAGLGDWGETFMPAPPPLAEDQTALDALAPRVGVTAERTVRKFQHRTILEHLVAGHLATLPTDQAFDILLPHLWFDPDWEVVAPAALAAHNRTHPDALLGRVLEVMNPITTTRDAAQLKARRELARVLLTAAADSEPDEWCAGRHDLIGSLRIGSLAWAPELIARTTHWPKPSNNFVELVVDWVAVTGSEHVAASLVEALPRLVASDADRTMALTSLLERITTTDGSVAAILAEGLPRLGASDADLATVRTILLDRIATAPDSSLAVRQAEVVQGLGVSDADRTMALTALLDRFTTSDDYMTASLAEGLPKLGASDADLATARTVLLDRIAANPTGPLAARRAVVLARLVASDADRVTALTTLLGQIAITYDERPAGALPQLVASDADRTAALTVLLDRITTTADAPVVSFLTAAVLQLATSGADRTKALTVLRDRTKAGTTPDFVAAFLAEALPGLGVSDNDRAASVTALLDRIITTDDYAAARLTRALTRLGGSVADRTTALTVLLSRISTKPAIDLMATAWAEVARGLDLPDSDRAIALTVMLDRITTTTNDWTHLAKALPGLVASDADRNRALTVVLDKIAAAPNTAAPIEVLPGLVASATDRKRALTVLLGIATTRNVTGALTEAVTQLAQGLPDRLDILRRHTEKSLPSALVAPARRILTVRDWLSLLREAP